VNFRTLRPVEGLLETFVAGLGNTLFSYESMRAIALEIQRCGLNGQETAP